MKLFKVAINECLHSARIIFPSRPFQPNLILVGKARSLLSSLAPKRYSLGQLPGIRINIRQGWKGLPGTNTIAFYENP
jgi:hypothetical protein